jgi:hypothetical protein
MAGGWGCEYINNRVDLQMLQVAGGWHTVRGLQGFQNRGDGRVQVLDFNPPLRTSAIRLVARVATYVGFAAIMIE